MIAIKRAVVLSVIIAVVIGCFCFFFFPRYKETEQCREISKSFINSVVNHDLETAKKLSRGKILWQLQNAGQLPKSKALFVDAKMVYLKGSTAKTLTVCEMTTDSGQDVAWYDLYLLKNGGKWKVYKISETSPEPQGIDPEAKGKNVVDAEKTIKKFILVATAGKKGSSYLAGPALKSYEQVPAGITNGVPQEIKMFSLYSNAKSALYKVSYKLQGRQVEVLFSLYKLDTWRIVAVTQI